MFNNIIYFIIVLLVFNLGQGNRENTTSLLFNLSMMLVLWFILVLHCRAGFRGLIRQYQNGSSSGYTVIYNRLVLRLSVISIFIFCLDVFVFNLNYWIESIPVLGSANVLQGVLAIILFTIYLSTIWYYAHPAHRLIYNADTRKRAFVFWNIRFNIPVVFPWLFLSLILDLFTLSPWHELNSFINKPEGQILFLILFLFIAMVFLPVLVQYFWGCRPIENSSKAESIRKFLKEIGLRYREVLSWPLLGGKMMTAGIMGIIPRFRYILVTDSLMEILTPHELNAVMAHEAGHSKYKHQILLAFLFIVYFVLLTGFLDPLFLDAVLNYMIYQIPGYLIPSKIPDILFAVPVLVTLIIYFRFIMGFFMRNFERQADTYAALTLKDPSPIITSLEKIALLSGKIRDVPSWHHFSIKQRVEFLINSHNDPGVITRHRRLIIYSFVIYLGVILSLSYLLYFTPVKKQISFSLLNNVITEELEKHPNDVSLLLNYATVNHMMGRVDRAIEIYEKLLNINRKDPGVLNNLAWFLLTIDDPKIKDIKRGFKLAKEAVELEPTPESLDTLAEAYWANGNNDMAIKIEKEAILLDKTNNPHYREQLKKFILQ